MMPMLLNYLRMGKGESFFMAANEPHAYLKGDILEVRLRPNNLFLSLGIPCCILVRDNRQ